MRHHIINAIQDANKIKTRKLFWQLASSIFLLLFVAEPLIFQGWYI